MRAHAKLITWTGGLVLLCAGCATRPPYEAASDPLEPVNRAIYTFNDYFDRGILKPVAKGYEKSFALAPDKGAMYIAEQAQFLQQSAGTHDHRKRCSPGQRRAGSR